MQAVSTDISDCSVYTHNDCDNWAYHYSIIFKIKKKKKKKKKNGNKSLIL